MPPQTLPRTDLKPIRPTRGGRLLDYLQQLFPPAVYVPSGLASFFSIHFALQASNGIAPLQVTWRALLGAVSVVLITLLLRANDELKDAESDRALAREGDPKYLDRALVTGHVREEDISALRLWVAGVVIAMNLAIARPAALAGFAFAMLVVWLSAKWFFWPKIAGNLLLAFATHNPIALAVGIYVVSIFAAEYGVGAVNRVAVAALVAGWLPIAAWETSRKVRAPGEETRYQTYSLLLGWKVAAALPTLFAVLSTFALAYLVEATGLPRLYLGVVIAANAVVAAASLRFRLRPTSRSANLRPFAEVYVVTVTVGLVIALAVTHGVRWV
ncbi:MAG: hypothetical protein M3Y59_14210 [Myxococcota bacterium]|nr:hypothetical protein [Myxococcota bacterium]